MEPLVILLAQLPDYCLQGEHLAIIILLTALVSVIVS